MSVTFVNLFEVAPERDEDFLARWQEVNEYMRVKPGYVRHTLHRALGYGTRYRYVNVAVWTSPQTHGAAHDDGFRALVSAPQWRDYPSTPGLFEVVHAGP
nr:hypothetical protein GCM10020063_065010 [Dactylosporangium thailandense]